MPVKKWISQSKLPNRLQDHKTISFRSDLEPEVISYIKCLSNIRKKSRFINRAIKMQFWLDTNPKGFIINLVQNHFDLCKGIVRKIGRSM